MLEKLSKKLHNNKGLTGADVAVSIAIIILTVAVASAIYINATNKSKEEIRYSAATRIATQIIENIESMTYDEVVYICDSSLNSVDADEDGTVFDVSVPTGYSAEITATEVKGEVADLVRDITVNVTYKISNTTKSITLYTTKEKELLEQTNEPNVNLIDEYDSSSYYAVKYVDGSYVVTTTSDSDWYNYDDGYYAIIYHSSNSYEYGDTIASGTIEAGDVYIWVPRFGLDSSSNLTYCYGTSSYMITFELYDDVLYTYTVTGTGDNGEYTVDSITSYVSYEVDGNQVYAFEENDGLEGVWYQPNSSNEDNVVAAYNALNRYNNIRNF